MRLLFLLCLGLSACAGSTPPPENASQAEQAEKEGFADQQRERWKQEDSQGGYEARRRSFVSNNPDRNAVQAQP